MAELNFGESIALVLALMFAATSVHKLVSSVQKPGYRLRIQFPVLRGTPLVSHAPRMSLVV